MIRKLEKVLLKAGKMILSFQKKKNYKYVWVGKKVECTADKIVSEYMKKEINLEFGNIPIISEEDFSRNRYTKRPKKYWIIDPIDGTGSFVSGFNSYVTQAALVQNDSIVLSAVHAPALNETFTAIKDKGTFKNGKRIFLKNKQKNIDQTTIIDNYPIPSGVTKKIFNKFKIKNYFVSGSIGLKICRIAEGTANIFIKNIKLFDWDIAAPSLILIEAGGTLKDYNGREFKFIGSLKKGGLLATSNLSISKKIINYLHK